MQELLQQLIGHLRAMWHRRWIGLAAAWVAAVVGVAVVFNVPQRYEASARVYVDTESLLRPLLAGLAIQPNLDEQVNLISRTLVSRPNVEKLLRLADLDLKVDSQSERDHLIDDVIKRVKLESANRSNLYVIRYADEDGNRAQRVVQSLLSIFVESSLGDKRQDTQAAVKFLNEQIAGYEKALKANEDKIKDFKLKYMGITGPGQGQDYFARAAAVTAQIDQAQIDLKSAEDARDAYQKQLDGTTPVYFPDLSRADSTSATPDLDARIDSLKHDLDGLLRKYTDQHPDVVATTRLIEQLEDQRRAAVDARRTVSDGQRAQIALGEDPVYQQLKISLANANAAVASARAKLDGVVAQQRQLKAQAQLVPQVEAEYTQLVRDYDIQKKTYDNLVGRRESAMMGKDVQETGGAQFRVIDPPRVSPTPIGPDRLVLIGGVLIVALGLGAFASLAVSQISPTFHDTRALRELAKRPILGMVSLLPSDALRSARRRNAWLFASGVGGLFASFAAVAVFALMFTRVA
jgi:polysaccharide chain length determinant protein (PEP-CTERM system associated)